MKKSVKKGFGFGLTSGIITTLGLIVGLNSGTNSANFIIGGILILAIADSMSDALGVHVSEESTNNKSDREIWESTFSTLFFKFIFALIFVFPFIFLKLNHAVIFSILMGISFISIFSYHLAKKQKIPCYRVISEHLVITILVIFWTHLVGAWISTFI